MNINKSTKGIIDAAILTAVIAVLALAGMYIPLLGILVFFVPTPLIILGKKHGIKYSIMALVASSLVVMSFSNPLIVLFTIAFPGVMAIVMGLLMQKKYKHGMIIVVGTIISVLATMVSIFLATHLVGISFQESIQEILKQSMEMQENMFSLSGADESYIEKSKQMMETMQKFALTMIPSAIILSGFLSSLLNYILALSILRKTGDTVNKLTPFRYFRLSRNNMHGLLVILILSLLVVNLNIVDQGTLLANIFFLYQLLFITQGLAVLVYYLSWYKVNKVIMFIIFILLIISRMGLNLLFVVGIIDALLNLRKYKSENE